jgi:hypothetical protein
MHLRPSGAALHPHARLADAMVVESRAAFRNPHEYNTGFNRTKSLEGHISSVVY